jgi:hypothetical protein
MGLGCRRDFEGDDSLMGRTIEQKLQDLCISEHGIRRLGNQRQSFCRKHARREHLDQLTQQLWGRS